MVFRVWRTECVFDTLTATETGRPQRVHFRRDGPPDARRSLEQVPLVLDNCIRRQRR